jgi:hypothetical protein
MPSAEDSKKRSVHVYTAKPTTDNDETRVFQEDGEYMILKNHQGGYFTHALRASQDIDMSGVMAGRGKGYVSFQIEEGDEAGGELLGEWRQARTEVIVVYREWKDEEEVKENKKTVVLWGYIANSNLHPGSPGSLGIEVHCVGHIVVNDAIGTRQYAIDCITGASTIKGGSLGSRQPHSIAPPGTPESENWGELLEYS